MGDSYIASQNPKPKFNISWVEGPLYSTGMDGTMEMLSTFTTHPKVIPCI
jgi:hypothetical protein